MQRSLLISLVLVAACGKQQEVPKEGAATERVPVVAVRVGTAVHADVDESVTASGKTEMTFVQRITAPITGTVLAAPPLVGAHVGRGAVMATVRPKDSQMQINGAQALLASATTPEAKAEAEHMLALATATDNATQLRAPIAGIIAVRNVNAGELVSEGAEICSIIDPASMVFTADVPLDAVARIRIGMRCRVQLQALPGAPLDAVVAAINPQSTASSQTVPVRLRLVDVPASRFAALKSDMNGTVTIVLGVHHRALMVPAAALLRNDDDGTWTVITVGRDSLARIIAVRAGLRRDSLVEVSGADLTDGMPVIVEGQYALADSTHVTVTR